MTTKNFAYEQADAHYALLQRLRDQDFFDANGVHASINNPHWFPQPRITSTARNRLHNEIIQHVLTGTLHHHNNQLPAAEIQSPSPHQEHPIAILLAGPPGSGKSTAKREVFGEIPGKEADTTITNGLPSSAFVLIDADEIKTSLINQARVDGSLDSFLKPSQVKELERQGEVFSDLDLASLVHEESSIIAADIGKRAIEKRYNIVFDQVCSSQDKTLRLVESLNQAGYSVRVIELQATRELSEKSVFNRYRRDQAQHGTGRYVPTEVLSNVYTTDAEGNEVSKPQHTIDTLLSQRPCKIEAARRYLSTEIGAPPHLLSTHQRTPTGDMHVTINKHPAPLMTPPQGVMSKKDALSRLTQIKKDKIQRTPAPSSKKITHGTR